MLFLAKYTKIFQNVKSKIDFFSLFLMFLAVFARRSSLIQTFALALFEFFPVGDEHAAHFAFRGGDHLLLG